MHALAAALGSALFAVSCATAPAAPAADDPPPPAPAPAAPPKEDPAPAKEEPVSSPGRTPAGSPTIPGAPPEVVALLAAAAKRQGTTDLVGEKAPDRYRAEFGTVMIHSQGNRAQTKTTEIFALPAPGQKEARLRSEWVTNAGKPDEKRVILGHTGRIGWIYSTGDPEPRRFTDPVRDEQDIRDLDDRRRMLRLGLRVFFLGNLASGSARVTLVGDVDAEFPVGHEGETRKASCRVLERAAVPAEGEPALRLYLDKATLDPVAVEVPRGKEGEPGFLLTLDFIQSKEVREKRNYPAGVRVPDWLELFELPADAEAKPAILIQAELVGLVIDPAKVPDSVFAIPKVVK